jgi:hypothetical protein
MNRANRIKSKLYDGKPVFMAILSGNGYFGQWQTFQHQCSRTPPGAERRYSRRQLLANAAIAASRVSA